MSALQLCKDLWLAWVIVWFAWALRSKRNQQSIGLGPRLTYTIPVLIGSCLVFMDRKAVPLAFLHDKLVPAAALGRMAGRRSHLVWIVVRDLGATAFGTQLEQRGQREG